MLLVPLGLAANVVWSAVASDLAAFSHLVRFGPGWLVAAGLLAFVPWVCNTLRVHGWLRTLGRPAPYSAVLRLVLACEVGAAVTPTAIGGSPVKIAMLVGRGTTSGEAMLLTAMGTLEEACFMIIALPPAAWTATRLGLAPWQDPGAVAAARFAGSRAARANRTAAVVSGIAGVIAVTAGGLAIARRWVPRPSLVRRVQARILTIAQELRAAASFALRRGRGRFAVNVALAGVQWTARLSVIAALAAGLGLPIDPVTSAVRQWICFTAMSVIPTPGGAGGAETIFVTLYSGLLPQGAAIPVAIAWRFLTFYLLNLSAALMLVAFSMVRRAELRSAHPAATAGTGSTMSEA